MPSDSQEKRSGTQSIERALRIIADVAAHGQLGARLTDIAQRCELDKGTVSRVLSSLVKAHVVEQRATDRRFLPGQRLFELGLTVTRYRLLQEVCREPMERAAQRFSGAAFVYVRSGTEVVCVARHDAVPVKSAFAQPGTRRPMAALAAGLAILSHLTDDEADTIVKAYALELGRARSGNAAARRQMIEESRRLGYGLNHGNVAAGLVSVAAPIMGAEGAPLGSISVVMERSQLSQPRLDAIAASLRSSATVISRRLAQAAGTEDAEGASPGLAD